jgi:hypothetical protein
MASQHLDRCTPDTIETQSPKHLSPFYAGLMRAPTSLARYAVSLVDAEARAEPQERRRIVLTRLRAWLDLDSESAKDIGKRHEEATLTPISLLLPEGAGIGQQPSETMVAQEKRI